MLRKMQTATVSCPGSALGDAVGISWMLRDVEGTRFVAHGGDTTGQHSIFEMAPERRFALTSLTNCGPNGNQFNDEILRWTCQAYLGIDMRDPIPGRPDQRALAEYAGQYETIATVCHVTAGDGCVIFSYEMKPEVLAQLGEDDPHDPPMPLGILDGEDDRYVVIDGQAKGMRGYFSRASDGSIDGMHIGGRFATRTG
jgi:hypothetical protein